MNAAWPEGIWLLLLVPVVLGLYVWMLTRRRRYALRYSSLSLVHPVILPRRWQRHIAPALFLLALSALFLATTRPIAALDLLQPESIVMLTIDVSGSMNETDLRPTRLEAAKAAARVFIDEQPPHVRIGLVAFTDYIALELAPTGDRDKLMASLDSLKPMSGTAIGDAILASLRGIAEWESTAVSGVREAVDPNADEAKAPPATIVLLTDGQSNSGVNTLDAAREAAARGTRVYTIGLASTERSVFRMGGRAFPGDIDEAVLKKVAELTDASYLYAGSEGELLRVYQKLGTQLTHKPVETELTFVLAGIGAALAILSLLVSTWYQALA